MNWDEAKLHLEQTFAEVKDQHSSVGHEYIMTHWNRYIHIVMRMPRLAPGSRVMEVGASILSNLLKSRFQVDVTTIHHELEPEWIGRFDKAGIHHYALELMRDPLPVPDSAFDLILFNEVLEHFPLQPEFFMKQLIAKLKETGQLMFSVPNFATLQKRMQMLFGKNPQDPMDSRFVYYAHHREPVMEECLSLVRACGGRVVEYEWSNFDRQPGLLRTAWYCLRCLRQGMFHNIVHLLVPSMRRYIFIRVQKGNSTQWPEADLTPPLSITREYMRY